jgi:trehalose 6-phosphate synthase
MARREPLIIVSNRGPVGFRRGVHGEVEATRGAGGLVTALRPLVDRDDVTWVASAMGDVEREIAGAGLRTEQSPSGTTFSLRLAAHDAEVYRRFYAEISNPVLWFVQHGLWDLKQDPEADLGPAWRDGYVEANRTLAAAVVEELDRVPDAPVLVHDYHLYLVPTFVRAARPDARIAHFTHIPWVGPESWAVLPREIVDAIHEGLLACDSAGFHTEHWRSAFVDCCGTLLGRGADAERVSHANPIAVDAGEFDALAAGDGVRERRDALAAERPEILVLRVDRADPSKNAVRGFEAFERLLERVPALRGRVGLLALLDPSREEIPEYVDYRAAIERAADEVNERFARPGWRPVSLVVRDDFLASIAAYLEYDVLLVNPVMDGLNLVAKEAPLVNDRDGVLVLSREAGAFEELSEWVVPVDPLDVEGQAAALERAIGIPAAERRSWLDGIRRQVRMHDMDAWADRELRELDERAPRRDAGATMRS